ncbi:TonB-dependent siderophore receptor [Bradyrhizobium sp. STM 3557]|uniref:TonB-dependent siderophore receptor n=1 Tax=Bradyrhizobium sp. STM 3557 TaxID=578920 RepID=UPI003890A3AB
MKSQSLLRVAALATVSLVVLLPKASVAQSAASGGAAASQNLPPVTIDAPKPRRVRTATPTAAPSTTTTRAGARQSRSAPAAAVTASETAGAKGNATPGSDPRGPINGYVATRSMTGTKTNTPIMETPQAISVIGAEEIRDQKPQSLAEALHYAPGVNAQFFGSDVRNDWFKVRGFDAEDVGFFMDGLQLFSTGFATWKLQTWGLERIDILRGPSAVLYGGSGPGGIINAISKVPSFAQSNTVEAGINSFGNAYTAFDFTGPFMTADGPSKELAYRVLGSIRNGGTQTDFTPDNSYFIAPSFTYQPDLDTRFTVLASATKYDTRPQNFLPYTGTVVNAPFGRIPTSLYASDPANDTFKREQEMIGYQFEKNLTDSLTFRQNARFAHDDVTLQLLLGNNYDLGPDGKPNPASASLSRFNSFNHDIANQANLDNQFEYRFNTWGIQHTTLVGVDLKHYRIDDLQSFAFGAPSLNLLNPTYGYDGGFPSTIFLDRTITQKQAAIYAQEQMKIGKLTLVFSGRNDWVDTDLNNRIGTGLSRDDSRFSGRVGAIYNTDVGIAPYVSYSTSYNPVIGTNAITGLLLIPETGQQAEIGIKVKPSWLDGYFAADVFDLKRQNVLTATPTTTPAGLAQSLQIGEVTSRGVELEAVANITPELKVRGSYTNFRIFVSKDLDPSLIGNVPTNTPSEIAALWGDYTFKSGWLSGFGFGGGVRYNGHSYADAANTLEVPSFVVGDAALHYEVDRWRFALNVTNITDKIYVAGCSSASACFYADRRRATLSATYKW